MVISSSPSIKRSPSSSSPVKSVSVSEKTSPDSTNLALSLHVIHNDQPIPLKTIYNSSVDLNLNLNLNSNSNPDSTPLISCRRRSPRLNSGNVVDNNVRDLVQVPVALALPSSTMHLRRSPRLDSPVRLADSSLSDAAFNSKSLSKKRKASGAGVDNSVDNCGLRKSHRLSSNGVTLHVPVGQKKSKDVGSGTGGSVNRIEKRVRSRAVNSNLCELASGKKKTTMRNGSKLRGLGSNEVSEKCLKSREFRSLVAGDVHVENKFALALIELPVKKPDQTPINNKSMLNLDMSSGKQLRSRNVTSPTIVADNIEMSSLIEHTAKDGSKKKANTPTKSKDSAFFIGEPIAEVEARERWGWRYELKSQRRAGQSWILNADEEDETILNVECHYSQAKVAGCIFNIGDCAFIKGDGKEKHVGRILELFRTTEGEDFFRVQWFYKPGDTVMKDMASFHDKKRLFYSTLMNDNPLDCLISKVNVLEITRGLGFGLNANQSTDFYYDMEYCVEYSTFRDLMTDNSVLGHDLSSINYTDTFDTTISTPSLEDLSNCRSQKSELALLDLYSGCGGMSTGLCLGAKLSSVNLVTRWAVDYEKAACDSLKLNHPETQVQNMPAEDFLELLIEWEKLCNLYAINDFDTGAQSIPDEIEETKIITDGLEDDKTPSGEYEVSHIVDISYGPSGGKSGKRGLKFKVRWKGYDTSEDTWEPIESLSNCQDHLRDFVTIGSKSKILPVPGDVDVICGGPPCQGISGYNRFRNVDAPLTDERNRQIIVFMDIVKFLKPRYVLMENVADLLRFDKGSLGRYALSRMVHMRYQARIGIMAAGSYGLPQFRLRVFLWGALSGEKLPQFPLPTHDVVVKFWPPPEFEQCTVAYNEGQARELEEAAVLRDAISDLPAVTSHEIREEMTYEMHPETEFQKYIRLNKHEIMGFSSKDLSERESSVLYDHRTYQLNEDDYLRVCQVPRKKGANFRDFPGVVVDKDNRVHRDQNREPVLLPSGKLLVPDYVFTFEKGKSRRPFARLWWDETVGTVVTFPSCHNMAALHPEQDRVLTLREFARLQGFPDFYRFCGTVKERYCQVGNAVAVPVARALGYALGMAIQKLGGNESCMKLPPKFSVQVPEKAENFVAEN